MEAALTLNEDELMYTAEDSAKDANLKAAHEALVMAKVMLIAASGQTDDFHEASRLSNFGTRVEQLVYEVFDERFGS